MQSAESICSGRIPCGPVVNFAKTATALSNRAVASSAARAETATALIKNKNDVTFTIRERPLAGPLNWDRSRKRRVPQLESLLVWAPAQQDGFALALCTERSSIIQPCAKWRFSECRILLLKQEASCKCVS
jgi:hypothetical protein